jgi:hypothetical protein
VPILPLVDLLILLGSGSLAIGFLLKAITIVSIYRPAPFGFTSLDFVVITGVCFGLALVFIARTWLKLNEPSLLALKSRLRAEQAQARAMDLDRSEALSDASVEAHSEAR